LYTAVSLVQCVSQDFADTFKVNKTMIHIDLSDNNIGPDGAKAGSGGREEVEATVSQAATF